MKRVFARAFEAVKKPFAFVGAFDEHALYSHAAATGFFLFFSIAPAVLALVSLASLVPVAELVEFIAVEGRDALRGLVQRGLEPETGAVAARIVDNALGPWFDRFAEVRGTALAGQIQRLLELNLPPAAAAGVGKFVQDVLEAPRPGLMTVGFVMLLWSASGAARMAMRALNEIYEVRPHAFMPRIAISLALTVAILAGASVTLTALPLGNTVAQGVVDVLGFPPVVLRIWATFNWASAVVFMLLVAGAILRYGPNARQAWRHVWPGAALTVVLWAVLGVALRTWTMRGWEQTNATYGALSAVILLMMWCYLVSAALLVGAEINAWYVERRGIAQRVVGGRALPYARRWPKLEPYAPGPPLHLLRRFISRLRRESGGGATPPPPR